MKVVAWIVGGVVAVFLGMLLIGAMTSDETRAQQGREVATERFCERAMADAALGTEKRRTREICDQLKKK